MKIRVERRNIERSYRYNPRYCPISLTLRELVKPSVQVHVTSVVTFMSGIRSVSVPLPEKALFFVIDFDRHGPTGVTEISFELEVPDWAVAG